MVWHVVLLEVGNGLKMASKLTKLFTLFHQLFSLHPSPTFDSLCLAAKAHRAPVVLRSAWCWCLGPAGGGGEVPSGQPAAHPFCQVSSAFLTSKGGADPSDILAEDALKFTEDLRMFLSAPYLPHSKPWWAPCGVNVCLWHRSRWMPSKGAFVLPDCSIPAAGHSSLPGLKVTGSPAWLLTPWACLGRAELTPKDACHSSFQTADGSGVSSLLFFHSLSLLGYVIKSLSTHTWRIAGA